MVEYLASNQKTRGSIPPTRSMNKEEEDKIVLETEEALLHLGETKPISTEDIERMFAKITNFGLLRSFIVDYPYEF